LGNKADSTVPEPSMLAVLLGLCCLRWFRTECLDPNSHRHSAPPLIITALLFCTLLSGRSLYADNISWDGSSDRNFNTPENWTNANGSNRKPGGLDNAIFGTENAQRLDRINLHGDQAVNAIRFRNVNSN